MILDVDAGNSHIKWRVVSEGIVQCRGVMSHDEDSWSAVSDAGFPIQRVRVANVAGPTMVDKLEDWVGNYFGLCAEFAVSQDSSAGVSNGYTKPETLGVDRWLAVIAGWNFVRKPCLVIDAGTALTVDFVQVEGVHCGGYIVPGLHMMHQALYGGTSDIRPEQPSSADLGPGKNTADAVQTGCLLMSAGLIGEALGQFENGLDPVALIITGGWGLTLAACVDRSSDFIPDLVLDGLALALP